ncbi:MAG TPA: hypothetical protein VGQ65_11365 [Thermoanaerobaculia bacterium]|jgi:hypothetical protein|nr:hypothetical protein [Thermoanaerobaculia bacterium]
MSVACVELEETTTTAPAAGAFYDAIQTALNNDVGPILNATVTAIAPDGQGDFAYNYENSNLDFNAQTFQFISGQVTPDTGEAVLTVSEFPGTMLALFNQIQFQPSAADALKISNARQAAAQAALNMVQTYTGQYGPVTVAQMQASAAAGWVFPSGDLFDYIVQVIVGGQWAGIAKPPGLSLTEMQNAENLQALLPAAPADAGPVLSAVSDYLDALAPAIALLDQQNDTTFHINQVKVALANPQAGTTGMTTFDPNGVNPATVVPAYSINKPTQKISNDLGNTGRIITVTASVSNESDGQSSVSINGSAGISLSAEDGLVGFSGETNFQVNMESAQGSGSEVDVTIQYIGWSDVPVQPLTQTITGGVNGGTIMGWYAPLLLKQAYTNFQAGANAASGPVFISSPQFDLDRYPNGDVNYLSTILISNYPTIVLHYTQGDYATFQKSVATQTSGSVSILGIPVASVNVNTYSFTHEMNSSNSDFTVTLTPTPPTNVPPALVTAHVIGGVVASPAV